MDVQVTRHRSVSAAEMARAKLLAAVHQRERGEREAALAWARALEKALRGVERIAETYDTAHAYSVYLLVREARQMAGEMVRARAEGMPE